MVDEKVLISKSFYDIANQKFDNKEAKEAYARTATFMALYASYIATGKEHNASLRFKMRNGCYFECDDINCTDVLVESIREEFDKLVKENCEIECKIYSRKAVLDYCKEHHMDDISALFRYISTDVIPMKCLKGYIKYSIGPMFHSTGYIKTYEIKKYGDGFVLILPTTDIDKLEPFKPGNKYFAVQKEAVDWTKKLGVNTIGKINSLIPQNNFDDLIIMAESYQDKLIGDIADKIKQVKKRLIMVAGPSSSGKTSFSNRLKFHLRAIGLTPFLISTDNFFVERDETPKDENGNYDFESIEAMDIKLLDEKLNLLLNGEETELPTFDFKVGKKVYLGNKAKLGESDIIILEGIHCLNPELTKDVDKSSIFSIYVSALAEVSIDRLNRIPTSDVRLIRRMERDRKTRGYSVKDTILRWDSVRKGEEKNIFPFQNNADEFFNTSVCYELNVLKTNVMPLLYEVEGDPEVGAVAHRLIELLSFFLGAYTEAIPRHAIIREFLGGSILNVG